MFNKIFKVIMGAEKPRRGDIRDKNKAFILAEKLNIDLDKALEMVKKEHAEKTNVVKRNIFDKRSVAIDNLFIITLKTEGDIKALLKAIGETFTPNPKRKDQINADILKRKALFESKSIHDLDNDKESELLVSKIKMLMTGKMEDIYQGFQIIRSNGHNVENISISEPNIVID